ncbi:MAG: PilZ domain-containing protein [Myxococcota bacterium]
MAGPVVFVGSEHATAREDTEGAARRAGVEASLCWDVEEARTLLARADLAAPRCVVVDLELPDLEGFIGWLRGEAHLFPVPVVVQVSHPDDALYLQAHSLGADDVVVRGDDAGITRRLRNLSDFDPTARPPKTQGSAVVAHGNELRRRVLGRILRQAGFDVSFALDADDLVRVAHGMPQTPVLMVADAALPGAGAIHAVRAVRGRAGFDGVPVVLTAEADEVGALRGAAEGMGDAAVTHEAAPPDNLLFLANELLRPDVRNVRASTRVLYGTICAFRRAGTLVPVYGLTYNISREGLYVRTLDPPAPGTDLWLEMRPPRVGGAVHLRAKAVWARGLRNPGGAAPPGFGVRLVDGGPADDRAAYETGYEGLASAG